MYGTDVSHWQGTINWGKVKSAGYDFAVIKCSEGTNFLDPMFSQNKSQARKAGVLCGFYHFARAYDPKDEADYFIKNVGEMKEGEFLVLDWEVEHGNPVSWCKKFLDRCFAKTGIKPMIYMSESRVKRFDWKEIVKGDYGLWVAKYASSKVYIPVSLSPKPNPGIWGFYALWQFSSKGKVDGISGNVDINYTTMDIDILKKYGKKLECLHCPLNCPA